MYPFTLNCPLPTNVHVFTSHLYDWIYVFCTYDDVLPIYILSILSTLYFMLCMTEYLYFVH